MKFRIIGKTNEKVSAIGLGCMGFSGLYGKAEDEISLKTLHYALESGINFWDTADVYGFGHNEELLSKALKGHRDKVFLCTKFALGGLTNSPGNIVINGKPEYVKEACEKSLRRLGVEVIDLYYQHRVDPETPIEETVGAMAELVKEGKVRYLGLSEASAETIRRAYKIHPIAALQSEYSLWSLDVEEEVVPVLKELGISLVAYSPLGRGFLSGQIKSPDDFEPNDWRRIAPRFQGENFYKNLELVHKLEELAKTKGCTTSQLALAWVLSRQENTIPIPGTRKIANLEENIKATEVDLSTEDLRFINRILDEGVAGLRYPEKGMKTLNG